MLRAIMVCVDYADLLAITLPYNHHHFKEIMVVTSPDDHKTLEVCESFPFTVNLTLTRSFYAGGAELNKWLALEEGLDAMGREGWLCIMDADVLWPKRALDVPVRHGGIEIPWSTFMAEGCLYAPLRRMAPLPTSPQEVPAEKDWVKYPIHRNTAEWAGYSQIFHASDPVLGIPPWHEVNWKHAGGADSFFQRRWPAAKKIRPPFEVLHLGEAGVNWYGRATSMVDGSTPDQASVRRKKTLDMWRNRRTTGGFTGEKLSPE